MNATGLFTFLISFAIAYKSLLWLSSAYIQPLRLGIAALGEQILAGSDTRERYGDSTRFMLDHPYSQWVMPVAAAVLPYACLILILRQTRGSLKAGRAGTARDYRNLHCLFRISAWASSPIVGTIFFIEFTVCVVILLVTFQDESVVEQLNASIVETEAKDIFALSKDSEFGRGAIVNGWRIRVRGSARGAFCLPG